MSTDLARIIAILRVAAGDPQRSEQLTVCAGAAVDQLASAHRDRPHDVMALRRFQVGEAAAEMLADPDNRSAWLYLQAALRVLTEAASGREADR